jgi:ADP-ribosylglycohydrolase
MRVAPVGLAAADPFTAGAEIAALTHSHPSGYLAAGAFARIVSEVASGRTIADAVIVAADQLLGWPGHEEVHSALLAAHRLADDTVKAGAEAVESLGAGWVAEEALAIAVYCALTANNVRSGLLLAASHSGDSDSTAAIAGNILGVAQGVQGLPGDLVAGLELRPLIGRVAADFADHFADGRQAYDLDRYPPN